MAGVLGWDINVTGRGGHGSAPWNTVDPIRPAAEILLRLGAVQGTRRSAFEQFVVSPCRFVAGTARNVIPDTAQISGSGQGVRDQLLTSLTNLIERITGSGSNDEIDLTQAQDRLYIGSSRGRVLATLEDTYYLKDMSAGVYEDNTWKAIAEEDYVDELGERYDYSRIDTLMSWMNIMGSSSEGMSVTLPSLTIQDMRGDDAHQLIPYHVEDIRGVDDMTFVQDRFIPLCYQAFHRVIPPKFVM